MPRLLIIDDEPMLLDLMCRYLGRLGYEIEAHAKVDDALARFEADPDGFAMVITDLSLPTLSGEEVIAQVRRIRPGLPAIISSGYPYQPNEANVGFLQKPFLPHMLSEAVEKGLKPER